MDTWDELECLDNGIQINKNEEISTPQLEKVLIFDGNNMAYRNLFVTLFFHPEDNDKFFLWRHQMLNDIIDKIKKFSPTKVVLAFDERGSWRYKIYERYKEGRKAFRDKSIVDFDKFFPVFDEYINDIKNLFTNMYVIRIKECEADDIIAVLTRDVFVKNNYEVIIISSDKDLNQLLMLNNVKQYDAKHNENGQGKFIECINPKMQLELKVLTGDKSDFIPAIKNRFGIVSAKKVLSEGLEEFLNKPENTDIKKNYERNRILIDFDFIPKNICETIINTYNEYPIRAIDSKKILSFFTKNRLLQLMNRWNEYSKYVKELK